jgi:hypothetical protein
VSFFRKHKNLIALLLIALFSVGIKQSCLADYGNKAECAGCLLIKTSPYIMGNTSYSGLDRTHHHALFFSVKVLVHLRTTSFFKSIASSNLLYLTENNALPGAALSILGLICKLQI